MAKGAALSKLTLTNFRSYATSRIELSGQCNPVILTGENGAGKTNILEAISFLSPGRGMRGSALDDITRMQAAPNSVWGVASVLEVDGDTITLGTGLSSETHINAKRLAKIDGEKVGNSNAFGDIVSISWLTPQMDRLFLEGPSSRRRFLDRLVLGLYPDHSRQYGAYERVMRERNKLLSDHGGNVDKAWIGAVEKRMAEHGLAAAIARVDYTGQLVGQVEESFDSESPFPSALLALDGWLENKLLDGMPPVEVEDAFLAALAASRAEDARSGRTNIGAHKTDLLVTHAPKDMPAGLCSTGEQKALLVTLVLASARLKRALTGTPPLMLLDEIAAHLDEDRRAALFAALLDLGSQCWMTGTDRALFSALEGKGEFYSVADGAIIPDAR